MTSFNAVKLIIDCLAWKLFWFVGMSNTILCYVLCHFCQLCQFITLIVELYHRIQH